MNPWIILIFAGIAEVGWAISLKLSEGLTKWYFALLTLILLIISILGIIPALKTLPMGVVYACWTGMGTIGITIAGILFFGDSVSPLKIALIGVIAAAIILLKLCS